MPNRTITAALLVSAGTVLAGCLDKAVEQVSQSPTAVTYQSSRRFTPPQDVEDAATTYCANRHLIPRMTMQTVNIDYVYSRYECYPAPK